MPLDQFLIAPMTEGLRTDIEPWLIPDQAFSELRNAYVWRGRVRKRFGTRYPQTSGTPVAGFEQLAARLKINLGDTDGSGNISGTVPGATFKVGQMFSIGTELFTVITAGVAKDMITNSSTATVFTYDTTSGAYDIQGSLVTTACYFYPAEPVMGFTTYDRININDELTYAFDTQFAYQFSAGEWIRLGTGAAGTWSGSNSQFFWCENYRGITDDQYYLFVTNGSATDNIRYWDGSAWNVFAPAYTATPGDTIEGCKVIISFHGRLLLLNTWESVGGAAAVNYPNRIRFSQAGSAVTTPTNVAWYEESALPGHGGYVYATTREAIIAARILRDRLIVFFERSTWELVYTNDQTEPFIFQKIDGELGAESTFSTVLFDKYLLGVGNVGIHSCNGANVERIDHKIPNFVFDFHNGNQGVERVHGIRDYTTEMVYWTIPGAKDDPTYPTRVLVYNYRNQTWAINDDTITAFGYLQNIGDYTWSQISWTWAEWSSPWNDSSLQSQHREIIAGNQEGYTFIVDPDLPRNVGALQITNLAFASGVVTVTAIDHNLVSGDYVLIEDVLGTTGLDGIYEVIATPTSSTFTVEEDDATGAYEGGGTIARVSQIDIKTKAYNFYQKQGSDLYVPKIGFYVGKTSFGQIAADYFISSSERSMVSDAAITGTLFGTSILETTKHDSIPLEDYQTKFWHTLYPQVYGNDIQIQLYLNETQMLNKNIALSDFVLHGMNIYAQRLNRY